MKDYNKSMERTFELLDTVDIKDIEKFISAHGGEIDIWVLMKWLEEVLYDEVVKYPELEGFLFDYVNDDEFMEYLRNRHDGKFRIREVIANYISINK